MLMSCFAARFSFVMIVSMTLLTTQCYDYVVEQQIESIDVILYDNSGRILRPLSRECKAEALVIRVIPNWTGYGDVYRLSDPLTAIRVTAIDADGKPMVMRDFKSLIQMPDPYSSNNELQIIDFEFDATGQQLTYPLDAIRDRYDFYLAYIPDGEPLTGEFRFGVTLEFKGGKVIEGKSDIVRLINDTSI